MLKRFFGKDDKSGDSVEVFDFFPPEYFIVSIESEIEGLEDIVTIQYTVPANYLSYFVHVLALNGSVYTLEPIAGVTTT